MIEARVRELPHPLDPAAACRRFADLPHCVLLESLPGFGRLGRHSFLSADPFLVVRSKDGVTEEIERGRVHRSRSNPFAVLERRLRPFAADPIPGLPPLQGGVAGYLGYDLCHHLERLPAPRYDDLDLPDLDVGFFDWVIAWEHTEGRAWLVSTGLPEASPTAKQRRAAVRERVVLERLGGPAPTLAGCAPRAPSTKGSPRVAGLGRKRPAANGELSPRAAPRPPSYPVPGLPGIRSTFTPAGYREIVARTIDYILSGDIFQANLSQRLVAPWPTHPFELYGLLREANPAPFAAYLGNGPSASVVSASPERFLCLADGRVEARPIKGTRPRGYTPEHDMALDKWLRASEKDRAENVMIVDLLRNDLSRVCEDGSVDVPELCVAEHYATVHHLVSTVVGRLRPGLGAIDLLRAAFPGGSVTGAPKVRAMEIIAELEPTRRSVYCGSIGYLGFEGSMDTSIVIRTFIVRPGGVVYFQVGGAVVADSDPHAEYEETLDKAGGLLAALEGPR